MPSRIRPGAMPPGDEQLVRTRTSRQWRSSARSGAARGRVADARHARRSRAARPPAWESARPHPRSHGPLVCVPPRRQRSRPARRGKPSRLRQDRPAMPRKRRNMSPYPRFGLQWLHLQKEVLPDDALHLHHLRHAIRALRAAARDLRDLFGGTAIRARVRQSWTTLAKLSNSHMLAFRRRGRGDGHRRSPAIRHRPARPCSCRRRRGNVLWDCISLVSDTAVSLLNGLGGLQAIAISHPHYYTTMVEWSRAFGNIPVYVHALDKAWVMRPDPCVVFWEGERREIMPGLTLIRCGRPLRWRDDPALGRRRGRTRRAADRRHPAGQR